MVSLSTSLCVSYNFLHCGGNHYRSQLGDSLDNGLTFPPWKTQEAPALSLWMLNGTY